MRSRHPWVGRRLLASIAVLSSVLAAACSWSLGYLDDGQSNGDGSAADDAGSDGSLGFADDSAPPPSIDANSAGDGASDAGTGDGGGNLMVNPSCENATFGWTTVSGTPLSSSSTFTHTGVNHSCYSSGRVDGYPLTGFPDASYDGPLQDITLVVSAGHEYSFSAWVLWAPPGAMPPPDAAAADAAPDADAAAADAAPDAAAADDGSAANAADGEAGTTAPEEVYVTLKETCIQPNSDAGPATNYVTVTTLPGIPEATWMQVTTGNGGLTIPENCSDISLYIGGPNVGMDLYTDQATLLFLQ